MRILIAGASGLLGSALVPALKKMGHEVTQLVRTDSSLQDNCIRWNPDKGELDSKKLESFDTVITLGGVNLTAKRWTSSFKQELYNSRVEGNALLARSLARLKNKPSLWLAASAVGYYGVNVSEPVDETSPAGDDYLAMLCVKWEAAVRPAVEAGIKLIYLRTGTVLSPEGGALKKMLTPFKLGLGGRFGSGQQLMSWISIDDWVAGVIHLLQCEEISGPVNMVAPQSLSNSEFTQELANRLKRSVFLPLPAWLLRLLLGEMSYYLLLSNLSVSPQKLTQSGFRYNHPTLADYLSELIDRQVVT